MPHAAARTGLLDGNLHRCLGSPKLVGAVQGIDGGRGRCHPHGFPLTAPI
jgi:hypothetical protein